MELYTDLFSLQLFNDSVTNCENARILKLKLQKESKELKTNFKTYFFTLIILCSLQKKNSSHP
jgi:hypothetical protein